MAGTARRHRTLAISMFLSSVAALALLALGCSDRRSAFAPIPNSDPNRVVAGRVRASGGALNGAIVTMETMDHGITASVRARLDGGSATEASKSLRATTAASGAIRSTVSDASGRFAFADMAPGDYLVTGASRDHLGGLERIQVGGGPIIAAETTFVDLDLTPTGDFYGGATLEDATNHQSTIVYVDGTSYVAVTNPSGGYSITGVPIGGWTIRATHVGYLDRSVSGSLAMAGDSIGLAPMVLPRNTNLAPIVDATEPGNTEVGVPLNFNGTASDRDGSIVRYQWDFEDDGVFDYSSPMTLATSHTYAAIGAYRARLVVTDDDGAIGVDVVNLTVTVAGCSGCIYVSPSGNNANPGTTPYPVQTISQGLVRAVAAGATNVIVAAGTYIESPVFVSGVSVRGSYDPVAWTPGAGTSTVNVGTNAAGATNITVATSIRDLSFIASSTVALAKNSIAMSLGASTGTLLTLQSCVFQSAAAAPGNPGNVGGNGLAGLSGLPGGPGNCDNPPAGSGGGGGGSFVSCPGGAGGAGGPDGANAGVTGTVGGCGGGAGGTGGAGGDPGQTGNNGQNGPGGSLGGPGIGGSASGSIVGGVWTPAFSGSGAPGTDGRGGGGGGGGGGQGGGPFVDTGAGNGGGGGGGGGGAGAAGGGGLGGYASFAVYLFNCSPTFVGCTFRSGTAGAGGSGGNGGSGAGGGSGGAGNTFCAPGEIGRGGNGGIGGAGGSGGSGAGGPGGPSYGVYKAGASTPTISTPTYVIGLPGNGGPGGTGAPSGSSGLNGNTN